MLGGGERDAQCTSKLHDPDAGMLEKIVRHRHSGIRVSLVPVVMHESGIAQRLYVTNGIFQMKAGKNRILPK